MRKMNIVVDPRMELLTALQLVARDPNIDRSDRKYYQDMTSWFTPYQDHYSVSHYKSINEYFCFDAPINSMLFMEFEGDLKLRCEPPEYFYLRAGGKQSWMEFFAGLQDFARITRFKEFFENHLGYYQQAIAKVNAINGNCDPATELESYIGLSADKYTFIFSPLQTCGYGGYGVPEIEGVSCTIGFDQEEKNERAEICLRVYLWHEFAHYYINPLLDEYLAANNTVRREFEKFIRDLQIDEVKYPFVDYYECCVRAITYKLTDMYYGKQESEGILEWDEEQGFMYVRHFVHALNKYDKVRAKQGVNFKEYFPILLGDVINSTKP
jgi:hypothetical protein